MKTFSNPRLHGFKIRHRERGISLMFVVVAIFALLGVAALAIDLVTLYVSKAEAQRVADAAALAGAKALVDNGVTADPSNTQNNWSDACDQATAQANVISNQGKIGGSAPATVTVNFGSGGAFGACPASGAPGTGFGVNPQVGVTVRSVDLPLFFAKIWGQRTSTVSASSRAEGFNPSGTNIPVAAKCVTPWLIANVDTLHQTGTPLNPLRIMRTNNGRIRLPGPTSAGGIIGESLTLKTKCAGPGCATWTPPSKTSGELSYYPIDLGTPAASGPSCSVGGFNNYMNNIVACNPTPIACGSTVTIDTTTFPDGAPNTLALNCLTNSTAPGPANSGQDAVNTATFPPTIAAGANHPLVVNGSITAGDLISSSRSVVTIPIYDSGLPTGPTAPASPVTVIGFMQAFVQYVDATGHPQVTVLNVSGCQTTASGSPVGTNAASAVPVRLIHP
jgi:Flp pilus assembly protein TadG